MEIFLKLTEEEALLLRQALLDLSQIKKVQHNVIVKKMIGSKAIWPSPSIHEVKGMLPEPIAFVPKKKAPPKANDSFNFIVDTPHLKAEDREFLFEDEAVTTLTSDMTMLDVLVQANLFPSKGQARKNGWKNKETIPDGWSEFSLGKKKTKIFIWKPSG